MKKNMKTILKTVGISLTTCLFTACSDMNSIFQEYLDRGEHIYISIADTLTIIPGDQRAVVKWKIDADPKLKETVIKWGDNDSIVFPIEREKKGTQWISKEIKGLPEGNLNFIAYNIDIYGNVSLETEKSQMIYGPKYTANQSPRKIASSIVLNENELTMTWNTMENCVGVMMYYTNREGKAQEVFIEPTDTELKLTDFVLGGKFSYKTWYKPTEDCLDTFITEAKEANFPNYYLLDRSAWIATASSDKAGDDGGPAQDLLDGDYETYWHSKWSPDAPLPHWILIDLKDEYEINEIQVYKRLDNTDCKSVTVFTGQDAENVSTEFGKIEFDKTAVPNGKSVVLDGSVSAKFIKCVITESWRVPYASLSEIVVYGKPK